MNEEAILHRRSAGWIRLKQLGDRVDVGWDRLSGAEVLEFVRLYRQASADLAYLTSHTSNVEVIDYLNAIVSRAYGQLYLRPRRSFWRSLPGLVEEGARVVRRQWWAVALCASIFFAGSFFAFGVVKGAPAYREHFVPSQMEELFTEWKKGQFKEREGGQSIAMTALYAGNNPRVGILMNAVSLLTLGLGTVYISWSNGTIIGALAAEMDSVGKLGFLLSSVAPHGVSEIGGLFIAGSGGLVLGWAVVRPGRRTRGQALAEAGKDAFGLLVVGLVMIVIAAPIEGFFSFSPAVPQEAKVGVAALSMLAYGAYFVGYGREVTTGDGRAKPRSRPPERAPRTT
ncbi:MAG: stage II sporulation protein M [Fimbriimonadaceae bacterium]|nr:stage II sporulation protein M [Fimbriimonadaceae bacterium]QYK56159.1 MAG: stage II sporulation protein M [Fimbriimonadaceae bacterium]